MSRFKSAQTPFQSLERLLAQELRKLDEKRSTKIGSEFDARLKALVEEYRVNGAEILSALKAIQRKEVI